MCRRFSKLPLMKTAVLEPRTSSLLKLEDPHREVMEMYCSPYELEHYNRVIGNPASGDDSHAPER